MAVVIKIKGAAYVRIKSGRVRKLILLNQGEREGVAMATARQWLPKIKSRAQVNHKRKGLDQIRAELLVAGKSTKRRKARMTRHIRENPLDFAMMPESLAIAETTDQLAKLFGPILQPITTFKARRGRLSNADRLAMAKIDLDSI